MREDYSFQALVSAERFRNVHENRGLGKERHVVAALFASKYVLYRMRTWSTLAQLLFRGRRATFVTGSGAHYLSHPGTNVLAREGKWNGWDSLGIQC